jgi:hypothetical protein
MRVRPDKKGKLRDVDRLKSLGLHTIAISNVRNHRCVCQNKIGEATLRILQMRMIREASLDILFHNWNQRLRGFLYQLLK